jgi:PAS domain S-box-containing protein
MVNVVSKKQQNIYNTIAVVKLASLLLCAISFSGKVFHLIDSKFDKASIYMVINTTLLLTMMLVLVYFIWWLFVVKIHTFKYPKQVKILESFIFIFIYSSSIFYTGVESNLKFIFLFTIIISTIEVNENFGIFISFLSSMIILIMDLAYGGNDKVNSYFQDDLILVGVFILTAWVIGHYVKLENEKMEQKNSELKLMNNEIREYGKQRQYMEELLLKVDSCYNLLIENSNDAIIVQSNDKVILGNESSAKLFGVKSINELINKDFLEFIPIKNQQYVHEQLNNVYAGKNSMISFEHKINAENNKFVTVRNTSAFFVYEGRPRVLSILHDITPEKQVEELKEDVRRGNDLLEETREFNKLITEFFSNISHELKTPLNVIFSAIQLINLYKDSSLDNYQDKQDKYMKIMKQNCYRLMRLINNLLDMTKLDSGFLKLNLGNYNIVSVTEEIVLSVVSYGESRGIDIIFDTDLEERIMTFDPDKIERIILNLMSNALKFTQKGGKVFVNLLNSNEYVTISIRDTGIGIPEDKLAVIFDRFMQVDKTLRRENEGTGIGLSLVKAFVEMHQGTVNIRSEINCGSDFTIKLPVYISKLEAEEKCRIYEYNVERMNIEFSDIYSDGK